MENQRIIAFDILPLVRKRIQDEYSEDINLGKPISYKELRRRFGIVFSFDSKTSNAVIKTLTEKYADIERANHGLILHKRR